TIGNLSGNNPYYLLISGFYFDTINKELTITFAKAGYLLENDSPSTTTIYYAAPITLNNVTANGSSKQTTTQLTLVFDNEITSLSTDDITLSGVDGVNKGILREDDENPYTYILNITNITSDGALNVSVSKNGYSISGSPKTATVYYAILVTLNSVIAVEPSSQTTTQLRLTFDKDISGLTTDDIILSGIAGVSKGALSGSNPYTLNISGFTSGGTLGVKVEKDGYSINGSPKTANIYYAVNLNSVSANGSSTQITTQLTLTFDKAINGLSVNDITLSGVSGVTKGTLSGSNPYTLNISSFTSGGTLNVAVLKAGFSISGSPATTTIYYPVTLNSVTANGSSTVTTTQLTLTFDKAINGLSVDDITLSGVSDVTKGTLSGSNPYYLSISEFNGDFPYSGSLSVSVSKDGYSINNSPKTVTIYYYTPPIPTTLNSVNADGSSIQITTQLTITFDKTIIGLNADDIKLSGINGVNKGLLSGSNPYTLPISGFTSGGTLTITVAKDGYAISDSSKTTTIYYPVTLDSVSANGSSTVTTTQLTLTFDKAINGLSVNDITLSGVSGVTKGTLSGSNPYTLNISGFTSGGALNVAVSKANYSINGSPKTATIYYVVNLNSVSANGSSMVTTTQLTLTFDKAINGLSADDIILSGIDGVSKGTLSGSNPYTLNVSGFTSGGTLSVSVLKVNYSITGLPKTATISYAIPATLNSVTASGSSMVTTTHLTLTFDKEITDLTSADITLSGVSNVSKGTLNGSNPYILSVSGFTSGGTLSVAVSKAGYSISGTPKTATIYYATPATLISVSANGSLTQTTTNLTLAFDQVITGLSVSDITLSGMSGVTKGTLTRSGNSYYLNVSGITSDGTLEVSVSKSGYNISDSPKTTIVYYAIPVNLSIVTANGSYNEATTQLTLTFNAAIPNLTVDDITLSGVSGVSKGTLSVSGSVYTLPISGFTSNGNLNVAVLKNGYSIGGSPKSVSIYYAIPVTLNVSADGSSTQTTTQLTLTFSAPIPDLIANNITLSGVSGVSKGTLIGSNPYILPISGFTSGGTMTITVAKEGYAISGSMTATIYYFKMEMIQVPGGSFLMGKELGTAGIGDVTPTHTVTLSAFSMSKYEVMQEQYQAVMGSNPSNNTTSGKRPVERVSWYDALVFCNKLSIIEGLTPAYSISGSTAPSAWGAVPTSNNTTWNAVEIVSGSTGYRLPTEAQWEYAAKGGNSLGAYTYSGSNTPGNVAAWSGNTTQTSTVGISSPNGLGLYDMSGNVSEWCWDWSGDYTSAAQTNPVGVSSGTSRVVRGGSYTSSIGSIGGTQYNYLRIVQRDGIQPHQVSTAAGIRLALPSGGTTPVTLNSVTADGSSTQNTTNLTLTFSGMVIGLTANDITLSGVSSVSKGTLTGSNPYTLPISGLTSGGTLNVSVSKADYSISGSPKTVAVYYSIPVTLNSVSANGSSTQTTTQLTLNFDQTIAGLTAADITLSGVSGVSKGALSVSGSTYTLPINGFTSSGNLNVAVAKTGYLINGSPKTTTIYNITPVTLNSVEFPIWKLPPEIEIISMKML
ncbi:SUMF1/EgtB/PvdO family nonheme iron enzyme, partial [Treponema sp. R6D11]